MTKAQVSHRVQISIYHYSSASRRRLLRRDDICVLKSNSENIADTIEKHIALATNIPACLSFLCESEIENLSLGKSIKIGWAYAPYSSSDIVASVMY